MMQRIFRQGEILKSQSGRHIEVGEFFAGGTQGNAYRATDLGSGEAGVFKVLKPLHSLSFKEALERVRYLVRQEFHKLSPELRAAPKDVIVGWYLLGHFSTYISGESLEEFLASPKATLRQNLGIAVALCRAIRLVTERGFIHGDLHRLNIIVTNEGPCFIDFDNYRAPGLPSPPCMGVALYAAPELRRLYAAGKPAIPDVFSDRFALVVLLHEIVLLKHPAHPYEDFQEQERDKELRFEEVMCAGRWLHDPAAPHRPQAAGYPAEVLNPDLARVFRRGLSDDPRDRPGPGEMEDALLRALVNVYRCPSCGTEFIVDCAKLACPVCRRNFPVRELVTATGRCIPLDRPTTVVGRIELTAPPTVSLEHAVFHKMGPLLFLQPRGINGTERWACTHWEPLPDGAKLLVREGDRLRFAKTIEARVDART